MKKLNLNVLASQEWVIVKVGIWTYIDTTLRHMFNDCSCVFLRQHSENFSFKDNVIDKIIMSIKYLTLFYGWGYTVIRYHCLTDSLCLGTNCPISQMTFLILSVNYFINSCTYSPASTTTKKDGCCIFHIFVTLAPWINNNIRLEK